MTVHMGLPSHRAAASPFLREDTHESSALKIHLGAGLTFGWAGQAHRLFRDELVVLG